MRAHPTRLRLRAVCGLAWSTAVACRAADTAPPAPLLAAVETYITDSLRPSAAGSVGRFAVRTDTGGSWASALVTRPASRDPRQATLELYLARAEVLGDSAVIHARLVSCAPDVAGINFSDDMVRLRFRRTDGAWTYVGTTVDQFADGRCRP